jgi:spermidine synthase
MNRLILPRLGPNHPADPINDRGRPWAAWQRARAFPLRNTGEGLPWKLKSVKAPPILWPQVYLSVALTTGATLLLELSLTRIFSVVFYYHMAFLAISIALFGLGAGGVFSYVVAGWKAPLFAKLGRLSAANSLLVIVALVILLAQKSNPGHWALALIYFTTALPFFVSGVIVSLAVSTAIARVNRVYFFDLLGAAGGCLLLVPLLRGFGGVSTVLGASVTFAAAAAIWHSMADSVRGRVASVALALALVAFLAYNQQHRLIDIRYAKDQALAVEMFQKWNDFSRIGLIHRKSEGRYSIVIDADAATDIATFDLDHLTTAQRRDLMEQGQALPYVLRPGAKTLVIGPGGGYDVARAMVTGSHDVTGVEINPIIANTIMQERFPELSHGLYLRPEVHIVVEDGRSFVRRSSSKYQVIQATLVDTWASTAAGAFALSENNLYTVDAVRDYLQHLTGDGMVAFTRWGFQPPRESLRLLALAREALAQTGQSEAWRNVMVVRAGQTAGYGALDTVLIARQPFSQTDMERAGALARAGGLEQVYAPNSTVRNPFYDLMHAAQAEEYERNYAFDITPVTDNRPFFFYTVQPRDLWTFLRTQSSGTEDYKVNQAVPLLFGLLAVSLAATLLILLLPPLVLGTRLPRQPGVRGFLMYFLFIGAGYILIEVGLIQKFVLFLGHPTYALTVVIFSMLLSSGLGSAFSRRLIGPGEGRLIKALGLVAVLAALLALTTGWLLTVSVGLPLSLKAVMTVVLLAPLGFVMGMPFPAGLERLEQWHSPSVRWGWSLNAAASVLGSVGALVLAIYLGLVQTLIIGGLFYLAALAAVARAHPAAAVAEPQPGANRVVLAQ